MKEYPASTSDLETIKHMVMSAFFDTQVHVSLLASRTSTLLEIIGERSRRWSIFAACLNETRSLDDDPVAIIPGIKTTGRYVDAVNLIKKHENAHWSVFHAIVEMPQYVNVLCMPRYMLHCESVVRLRSHRWVSQSIASFRLDDQASEISSATDDFIRAVVADCSDDDGFLLATVYLDSLRYTHAGFRHLLTFRSGSTGDRSSDAMYERRRENRALLGEKFAVPGWGYVLGRAAAAKLDVDALRADCQREIEDHDIEYSGVSFAVDDIVRRFGGCVLLTSSPTVAQGLNPDVEWARSNARIAAIFWSHLHKAGLTL